MPAPCFPSLATEEGVRQIAPTDIAQFIRLDQCERYLRLRMHERLHTNRFMRDYGVKPQSLPALLTRSGASFEDMVETSVAKAPGARVHHFSKSRTRGRGWVEDNQQVIERARTIPAGAVEWLFQPRVQVDVLGWLIRGDIDVLRLARDADGRLHVLIADMKATTSTKVEHRLQVAFYHEMIGTLFANAGIAHQPITLAILYRGPVETDAGMDEAEHEQREQQRDAAERLFGTRDGLLEIIEDTESYLGAVEDLVTGEHATAMRVAGIEFEQVPFHLTYKCDGCLYNEFCMKWCAEHDDLSLLPHLTQQDKGALQRAGVVTTGALAALMQPSPDDRNDLVATPGNEPLVEQLAASWPVGPRLEELVHRARQYRRWKGEPIDALPYIPSKGYGSLPYCDATHNPNLVRIYIDAQHDYLHDRIYLLGALLVGCENGEERPHRRRAVVTMTDRIPDAPEIEEQLFIRWIRDVLRALHEVAAPDENGELKAPIHLIFYNSFEQTLLLDGLARHFTRILGATPLYDFMTQIAAFDSPLVTFLDQEIRELKNYPMVCQSLQAVAAYRGFDWNQPPASHPHSAGEYRRRFRARLFDFWGRIDKPDGDSPWYTSRSRFNSQIPLEYAYAAWGDLAIPREAGASDYRWYTGTTIDEIEAFHARRLEALEHVAHDFRGNKQTVKSAFSIPNLDVFDGRARVLAQALDEFVTIEQHVALASWKSMRNLAPERRVLSGDTLLVRYLEEDQEPGVAEANRENERRRQLYEQFAAAYKRMKPDAEKITLPKDQKEESKWSQEGMRFWLRIETEGVGCSLDDILGLTLFKDGERLVINPRWDVDSRQEPEEQVPYTPTPKSMLWALRGTLKRMIVERGVDGKALSAKVEVELQGRRRGKKGYVFGTMDAKNLPFEHGRVYMLDPDPDNWMGSHSSGITAALINGEPNTLYDWLESGEMEPATWPEEAARAQQRFLDGLTALHAAGAMHSFEESKKAYIGGYGAAPILMVQGPPGTGKSYSTAFAIFARLQGAMAAGIRFRIVLSCKTHAAVDVLLNNVRDVQAKLAELADAQPQLFQRYFSPDLLTVPLFRYRSPNPVICPIIPLVRDADRKGGQPKAFPTLNEQQWCVFGAAPGGIRSLLVDAFKTANMFGHEVYDCLVLDEASQMNLPEAIMAALGLKRDGQLIVVGDHRQMPPIVQHDWANERRRTFHEYRTYDSLFDTLRGRGLPMIAFEESFRLHAEMAEFLRRQIYRHDGIDFHSRRTEVLPPAACDDDFVRAVLAPHYPLTVIVHDEAASQLRNDFEQALIAPVLETLAFGHEQPHLAREYLGVVVPHRAQRAALQDGVGCLVMRDPETGTIEVSAVDTVERFQGDERVAIVYSATESDPAYLLAASKFLMDPRRLNVALSRAKQKIIIVASRSVFTIFSNDEETFQNTQLWKNLLRHTCTVSLWSGDRGGHTVEVRGNQPLAASARKGVAEYASVR